MTKTQTKQIPILTNETTIWELGPSFVILAIGDLWTSQSVPFFTVKHGVRTVCGITWETDASVFKLDRLTIYNDLQSNHVHNYTIYNEIHK